MAFGLTMASIGIVSTYLLARRFVGLGVGGLRRSAPPGLPRICVRVSATFMTDVPAYALAMLCLLLGARTGPG